MTKAYIACKNDDGSVGKVEVECDVFTLNVGECKRQFMVHNTTDGVILSDYATGWAFKNLEPFRCLSYDFHDEREVAKVAIDMVVKKIGVEKTLAIMNEKDVING